MPALPRRPALLRSNFLLAIFSLAVALRIIGATFNLEANDPHVAVAEIMAYEHHVPADSETWEASQPRLYHVTVAIALKLLPQDRGGLHTLAGQLISCTAGIITLWLLLSFLMEIELRATSRNIAFALVALNPKMIATSIQAANDAFVILFGTLALVAAYRFLKRHEWRQWAWMTAGVLLVCITKGNGMAAALAVACAWLVAFLPKSAPRGRLLLGGVATLVAFAAFVPWGGGYLSRYLQTGQAFYIQMDKSFPPHFSEPTLARRPGITSIVDGYLTFRLVDLLRHPIVSNATEEYAANRTSMWSFAYASAHTQHYDNFPVSWQSDTPLTRTVLRTIYLLALLPTALLLAGIGAAVRRSVAGLLRWRLDNDWSAENVLSIATVGSIAFLMLYAYQYRDYGCMKPIFIYPAVAAFCVQFARAFDGLEPARRTYQLALAVCSLLGAFYVIDSLILLKSLTLLRLHIG